MKLILVRHGQSEWNLQNRFTGWEDVSLSEYGVQQAKDAGKKLLDNNINFDVVFTSYLKRAIHTAYYIMSETDRNWVPMIKDWRLNERHYGALQGLNKAETAQKYGDDQVHIWRRSYDVRPPKMDQQDAKAPINQFRYQKIESARKVLHESLEDTLHRTVQYYDLVIKPSLLSGNDVLIAAHGNSLRSLIKYLEQLTDQEVVELELDTGVPVVYTLDENLNIVDKITL